MTDYGDLFAICERRTTAFLVRYRPPPERALLCQCFRRPVVDKQTFLELTFDNGNDFLCGVKLADHGNDLPQFPSVHQVSEEPTMDDSVRLEVALDRLRSRGLSLERLPLQGNPGNGRTLLRLIPPGSVQAVMFVFKNGRLTCLDLGP
jgi:hypothetical protein